LIEDKGIKLRAWAKTETHGRTASWASC